MRSMPVESCVLQPHPDSAYDLTFPSLFNNSVIWVNNSAYSHNIKTSGLQVYPIVIYTLTSTKKGCHWNQVKSIVLKINGNFSPLWAFQNHHSI